MASELAVLELVDVVDACGRVAGLVHVDRPGGTLVVDVLAVLQRLDRLGELLEGVLVARRAADVDAPGRPCPGPRSNPRRPPPGSRGSRRRSSARRTSAGRRPSGRTASYSLSNASGRARRPGAPGAVPRMPVDGVSAGTRGEVARDQTVGDERLRRVEVPVRTSAGPTLANVSGKSMITIASGLPETICSASES